MATYWEEIDLTKYEDLLTSNNSSYSAYDGEGTELEALHILSVIPIMTPKTRACLLVSWVIRQRLRYLPPNMASVRRQVIKETESQSRSECKAYHHSATRPVCVLISLMPSAY